MKTSRAPSITRMESPTVKKNWGKDPGIKEFDKESAVEILKDRIQK
ncbi:MAG: hypothetical protein R6U17_05865 [Thermoplasmata archaeon]